MTAWGKNNETKLEQRIQEHNFKRYDNYTSTRLPIKLAYSQEFSDINDAIAAEEKLKAGAEERKKH